MALPGALPIGFVTQTEVGIPSRSLRASGRDEEVSEKAGRYPLDNSL